jgi:hypothetical protein
MSKTVKCNHYTSSSRHTNNARWMDMYGASTIREADDKHDDDIY